MLEAQAHDFNKYFAFLRGKRVTCFCKILRLCDGSGVAVRKDRLVRLGEWQPRFGRAEIVPAQSLLVYPCRNETARKSLRLLDGEIPKRQNLILQSDTTQPFLADF